MDWIRENKFISTLLGVTVLLAGGIVYFGFTEAGAFDEKMSEYEQLHADHMRLVKAKPYPDASNLSAREEGMKDYEGLIADVRKSLVAYQPGELQQLSPEQFSDIYVSARRELRGAFQKGKTSLPAGCGFGFEKYDQIQPVAHSTGMLNYQLGAMKWLLDKLAKTRPEALLNIRRNELDMESVSWRPAPPPVEQPAKGKGSRGKRKGAKAKQNVAQPVEQLFVKMPVELTFRATESSVRAFLREMANSPEYFYAIRAIRMRSTKQTAPTKKDANFPSRKTETSSGALESVSEPEASIFGDFALPGDDEEAPGTDEPLAPSLEPAPEPEPQGEHILKQVLGSEKLDVYIRFDILMMKGEETPDTSEEAAPGS